MLREILVVIMSLLSVSAEVPTRQALGYSKGYSAECPGSNKPAIITKKSLKHLGFVVQGPGATFSARRKRYSYYQLDELAKDPDIDFKKKTVLYVIGYMETPYYPVPWVMARVYKDIGYNAIILDVNWFTAFRHYSVAFRLMRPVGVHTAEALVTLINKGLDPKKLELVGVSLGGQTIGFIAKSYRKLTGMNITRITALDASGACCRFAGPEDRLDKSDADFVLSVHTNLDGFGMAYPLGHISYYVNGGEFQVVDEDLAIPCLAMCAHVHSLILWHMALLNPKKFIAIKCDSVEQARNSRCYDRKPLETNYMDLFAKKNKPGIYYLSTTNTFPYYLGMNGTKKEFDIWSRQAALFNNEDVITM